MRGLTGAWRSVRPASALLLGVALAAIAAILLGLATHGPLHYLRRPNPEPWLVAALGAAALGWAARRGPAHGLGALAGLAALLFGPGAAAALALTLAAALALGLRAFPLPGATEAADKPQAAPKAAPSAADRPPAAPGVAPPAADRPPSAPGAGRAAPDPLAVLLRLVAGLALLLGGLQATMALPLQWRPVHLAVAGLAILAGWRPLARLLRAWPGAAAWPVPTRLQRAAALALLVALLAATVHATGPETGYDALSNHLRVVEWTAWNGFWHFDPALFDRAVMPRGAGWLFTWMRVLDGPAAVKLLNAAAFWLTAGLVAAFAFRPEQARLAPPALTLAALAALAATPLTVSVMAQLFEETITTLFLTAALVSLALAWRSPGDTRQAMLTFLLLGAACAAKVQALFFGGLGVLAVVALFRGHRPGRAAVLAALGAALFAAIGLTPYLLATLVAGNPFFPFEFGRPPDPRFIGMLSADILWRFTFETSRYLESLDGAFGFQHLLLMPLLALAGLLAPRGGSRVVALVLLVFAVALVWRTQYARYLFYAMPGLLLLLPEAWARLGRAGRPVLLAGLALGAALNLLAYRAAWFPPVPFAQLLHPERFATRVPEERRAVAAINATHGEAARVFFAGLPFAAGLRGSAVTVYAPLQARLEAAATPAEAAALLRAERITHVVTATPLNNYAAPVPIAPALQRLLDSTAVEIPMAATEVRLFLLPPP